MSIDSDVVAEVHALHDDLALWLGTPDAAEALERFLGQQHPEFSMVTQTGSVVARVALTDGLRGAGNTSPGLGIDIREIEILHRSADAVVVRFEEVHRHRGGARSRLTTALLLADPQDRNGLRWRSVHETASAN
ncbi:hypothetical protein [Nocardia crassostreae]|uniref:hypothetical protein n=1 Tax=Nocardia crassostreae TaxID=53428 RepID=UPI00082CB06F|nr:hypothetical protein [Nocardia crassostreae]